MIRIKPKNKSKKLSDPYYKLVYNYMIGDANGYTTEEETVSLDNPYVERYITLMNSLKPTKGKWGIILNSNRLEEHFKEGQISKDDFDFLETMMFYNYRNKHNFKVEEENDEFAAQFCEGVREETEYSILVFEGCDLFYIDEFGESHETEIV